jgi:aspartate kinase
MEQPIISGIAFNRDEAKLTIRGVPDTPGVAFKILGPISAANIEVDMIMQNVAHDNTTDFTFTVHRNDYQAAQTVLENTAREIGAREVVGDTKIAKVSIVGVGHAFPRRRGQPHVRIPGQGKHQHPDDLDVGNQGFRGDRREVPGTGCAPCTQLSNWTLRPVRASNPVT